MSGDDSALARPENTLPVKGEIEFTRDQVDLIKRTIAKGSTDDELNLFLYQAKRTGLDPLARQIYCIKRGDKMSIETSIDGYRAIADNSGAYAGQDDYLFDGSYTTFQHIEAFKGKFPQTATVIVYKVVDNMRVAFTATARWDEYYPGEKQGFKWKKSPYLMLGKCAEALALRKAFPKKLSGVYTSDEMQNVTFEEPDIDKGRHGNITPVPMGEVPPEVIIPPPDTSDNRPGDVLTSQINVRGNGTFQIKEKLKEMGWSYESGSKTWHKEVQGSEEDITTFIAAVKGMHTELTVYRDGVEV